MSSNANRSLPCEISARASANRSARRSDDTHRRHQSISSTSTRARDASVTVRSSNADFFYIFSILFPSYLKTTNDQHRPFRTHESSMVSHTPPPPPPPPHGESHTVSHTPRTRRDAHEPNGATIDECLRTFRRERDRDDVPRTNEPNRTERNRTEPKTGRIGAGRARDDRPTRLDSSRGRHPSHSSLDGWWGRDGGENCSLDYSRLRSSERSDDESDAKARREDDQGEI